MSNKSYDWEAISATLSYGCAAEMWKDLYVARKLSTGAISRKFGVSQNTIRAELTTAHIAFRSRGGPNNMKISMTPDLAQKIKERGMATVAKELGLKYGTLYKRYVKYRGYPIREVVRRQQAGQDVSGPLDS